MGFIEKLSGSSLLLSLLTGLGIAVCVIAIIWLIMLAGENIAKSARRRRAAGYDNEVYDGELDEAPDEAPDNTDPVNVCEREDIPDMGIAEETATEEKNVADEDQLDDEELIAVISAAVAAYGGGNAGRLVVRKIKRLVGGNTPWSAAAKAEQIESRKF